MTKLAIPGSLDARGPATFRTLTAFCASQSLSQGKGGPSDVVLKNSGYVVLYLGGDRRTEAIGEKTQRPIGLTYQRLVDEFEILLRIAYPRDQIA